MVECRVLLELSEHPVLQQFAAIDAVGGYRGFTPRFRPLLLLGRCPERLDRSCRQQFGFFRTFPNLITRNV